MSSLTTTKLLLIINWHNNTQKYITKLMSGIYIVRDLTFILLKLKSFFNIFFET